MKRNTLKIILTVEAIMVLLLTMLGVFNQINYITIITFPFVPISEGLRHLSLSGSLGNAVALILYTLFCLIPTIIATIRYRQKKAYIGDLLLIVTSILLFVSLYLLINPGYMSRLVTPIGSLREQAMLLTSIIYLTIIGYMVLRLIKLFMSSPTSKLLKYLSLTFSVIAIGLVLIIFASLPGEVMSTMAEIRSTNTMLGISFTMTDFILVLKAITSAIPLVLELWILFKAINLVESLSVDQYSTDVVMASKAIEKACSTAIIITTISAIVFNLIQLMMLKQLLSSNVQLEIPLTSIVMLLVVMLFARYFADSHTLKEEIDMFI